MTGTRTMLALGLMLLNAGMAAAAEATPASRYFAARGSGRVLSPPLDTVRLAPGSSGPLLVEVRGTVTGHARRADGATLIVDTGNAGTYVIDVPGETGEATEAGQSVRLLARIPDGPASNRLTLVALVTEYEAATYEAEQARKAALAAARPKPPSRSRTSRQKLASRGSTAPRTATLLQQYAQAVLYFNRRLSPAAAMRIAHSILNYSIRYGLDPRLVMAVVAVESNFNAYAVSPKGAMGLGQLMPGTALDLGVADPWSPEQNIEGATRLLSGHLARLAAKEPTEEAIRLALACYNAGAGAVKKHRGIPPYRETQNYVKKVTRLYYQMCGRPVRP